MTVLFMCYANSIRSQMAEGLARKLLPKGINVLSAGVNSSRVHSMAVKSLGEIGIDISGHKSQSVEDIDTSIIDLVIVLTAENVCPPSLQHLPLHHWPTPDPSGFVAHTEVDMLTNFRKVRQFLETKIVELGKGLS